MQYRSQLALTDVIDPADPLYQGTQLSAWIPRFGCGLMVRHPQWDAGISAPTLFVVDHALDGSITSFYRNHVYAHAGYHAGLTPWLTLHPSVLFRSTPDVPSILDVNLLAEFTGIATVGVGWLERGGVFVQVSEHCNRLNFAAEIVLHLQMLTKGSTGRC